MEKRAKKQIITQNCICKRG